jgi:hypothetical protein
MREPAVNPGWRKSSYSGNGGSGCVEVGATPWRKSTYSENGGSGCVEAAHIPGAILVRDTRQHGHGPVLRLPPQAWHSFTVSLRTAG